MFPYSLIFVRKGDDGSMILYHGSGDIVEFPEIRKTKYTQDLGWQSQRKDRGYGWKNRSRT